MATFLDSPCLTLVAVVGRLSWKLFSGLLSLLRAPRLFVARAPGPANVALGAADQRQQAGDQRTDMPESHCQPPLSEQVT